MAKPTLSVRQIRTAEHEQWKQVLASAPEGSPYLLPEYLSAIAKATDRPTPTLIGIFENETDLVGGIGLYRYPVTFGEAASSRLMLYYNGPFLRPAKASVPYRREQYRRRLHTLLESYLRELDLQFIRFKARDVECDYRHFIAKGWQAKPVYSYVVDLRNLDAAWDRIDNNLRRLIRRCDTAGMQFHTNGSFDSFFAMHFDTHKRKGAPLYLPRERFRNFVEEIVNRGQAKLFQVSLETGEPIASQLVLCGHHPVAHTICAGAYEVHQQSGCNALLRWRVCQWLASKGHHAVDLTDAHNPEVAKFKSQLGAELVCAMQVELPPSPAYVAATQSKDITNRVLGKVNQFLGRGDGP